jgi:cytochrome P450
LNSSEILRGVDRASLPPGPRWPSFVQFAATWTRPAGSLLRMREKYGPTFTARMPFTPPFVFITDPQAIKELFQAPADVIHPGEGAVVLEPLLGSNSLILLDEDPHLEHRRLLLPAFHGERMRELADLMAELTEAELNSWPVGEPLALHPLLQRLTLEIMLRAVFGLEQGARLDDLRETVTEVLGFGENPVSIVPALRKWLAWTKTAKAFEATVARNDELIYGLVAERRAALAADPGSAEVAPDVLAMLLAARHEDGSAMSDAEIRDELVTAVVAGHETTASQLAWLFMRLARAPWVVAKLVAELDAGEGDEYLTAALLEIQRLHPVVSNAEPRLVKQPTTIGGIEYPAGVAILASVLLVHRDPEIYPEPNRFRPERFLGVKPGTYTWLSFGGGRRRCIGAAFAQQEMEIITAAILRRFTLAAAEKRLERTRRRGITFSPAGGATVVLGLRRDVNGYQSDRGPTQAAAEVRPLPAETSLAGAPARSR